MFEEKWVNKDIVNETDSHLKSDLSDSGAFGMLFSGKFWLYVTEAGFLCVYIW